MRTNQIETLAQRMLKIIFMIFITNNATYSKLSRNVSSIFIKIIYVRVYVCFATEKLCEVNRKMPLTLKLK